MGKKGRERKGGGGEEVGEERESKCSQERGGGISVVRPEKLIYPLPGELRALLS